MDCDLIFLSAGPEIVNPHKHAKLRGRLRGRKLRRVHVHDGCVLYRVNYITPQPQVWCKLQNVFVKHWCPGDKIIHFYRIDTILVLKNGRDFPLILFVSDWSRRCFIDWVYPQSEFPSDGLRRSIRNFTLDWPATSRDHDYFREVQVDFAGICGNKMKSSSYFFFVSCITYNRWQNIINMKSFVN